jgi:diaminopimelate decarboxylase
MNHFNYKDDNLFCEEVALADIAEKVGTPFYCYSKATLARHFKVFDEAFGDFPHLVCYSVKVLSNIAILSMFNKLGSGFDIVSGGELFRALRAGADPKKIVYSGVGKTAGEIKYAIESGILMLNVESLGELEEVSRVAAEIGGIAPISLRINPDVDPQTHPYISTGMKKNKFGIPFSAAVEVYKKAREMPNIEVIGIDCHIGSQLTIVTPFVDALERLIKLYHELRAEGFNIRYIDLGGGLGITYEEESPPSPKEFADAIIAGAGDVDATLVLEPGRVIAGNAGVLVTRLLYDKQGEKKRFFIVDAAMNDLVRPSLYGAFHEIVPVVRDEKRERIEVDVVGPICESGDYLARERTLESSEPGDLLAVLSAGAYGFIMGSNYNSRVRVPEILVDGDTYSVIRERETYQDLVANEYLIDAEQ